jgi:Cytochrome oxidase complex assembly protein 1
MATPPYPLQHTPVEKTWLDRNARWKIPLGCLILVVFMVGFIAFVFTIVEGSFRRSTVFQEALARAERNAEVANRVGAPLKAGWGSQGSMQVSGSSGTARMSIPVTGPRGRATIYLDARKTAGTWTFNALLVQFGGQSDCLNLLAESGVANASCDW